MTDQRCERCAAKLHAHDDGGGEWSFRCPNRACGMCPDYRPALLAAVPDAEDERRAVIRETAMRLYASGWNAQSRAVAWSMAKSFWDAKPDDC